MELTFKSPFGFITIIENKNKITRVYFDQNAKIENNSENEILNKCKNQLKEYFEGKRKVFELNFEMQGTDFQKKIWEELFKVPYGTTISYKELAQRAGRPKAVRAVGNANRINPIPIIFPCHRVIGSNGKLVGYWYGLDMKQKLLDFEQNNL